MKIRNLDKILCADRSNLARNDWLDVSPVGQVTGRPSDARLHMIFISQPGLIERKLWCMMQINRVGKFLREPAECFRWWCHACSLRQLMSFVRLDFKSSLWSQNHMDGGKQKSVMVARLATIRFQILTCPFKIIQGKGSLAGYVMDLVLFWTNYFS